MSGAAADRAQPLAAPETTVMKEVRESTGSAPYTAAIDSRRKSLITVLARVLARDLNLAPPVAKEIKRPEGN